MFDLDLTEITVTIVWEVQTQQICYNKYTMKAEFITVVSPYKRQ